MKSPSGASVLSRILRAFLTVAVGTLLVKGLALVKDLVVAYRLGVGDALDAFLMAFLLPSVLALLVGRAIASAAVPVLMQVRSTQGEGAAARLAGAILLLGGSLLGVLVILLMISADGVLPWLSVGFDGDKQALTHTLLWWLLPVLWFGGMSHLTAALLHAQERFALVALAPGVTPLVTILALVLAVQGQQVWLLAGASAVGCLCEWLVLLGACLRRGAVAWPEVSETVLLRRIAAQFTPLLASQGLVSGVALVDQGMAATLPAGSVASLSYAAKLPTLMVTLGCFALSASLLPHFSGLVAAQDWRGLRETAWRVLGVAVLATLPVVLFVWVASTPLVVWLFQRGAFDPAAVPPVALSQQLLMLQLPFCLASTVLNRVILACEGGRVLLLNALLGLLANALLNLWLMGWMGVAGIALSTSLSAALGCVYLGLAVMPLLRNRQRRA